MSATALCSECDDLTDAVQHQCAVALGLTGWQPLLLLLLLTVLLEGGLHIGLEGGCGRTPVPVQHLHGRRGTCTGGGTHAYDAMRQQCVLP